MKFRWSLAPLQPLLAGQLARTLQIPPLLAQCLLNRAKVTERAGSDRARDLFSPESTMDHFVVGDPNVPDDGSQRSATDPDDDDDDMQPDTVFKADLVEPPGEASESGAPDLTSALAQSIDPELAAHTAHFEKKIYRVTGNVYSAVGYSLGNSVMIEGDTGVVIVDTVSSVESARQIREEFRKITTKPVAAVRSREMVRGSPERS